jgi:hypothetical protein
VSFWLLAPYIAVQSCYDLATREHATVSRLGIALTVSSIVVMPLLAALRARDEIAAGRVGRVGQFGLSR